MLEVDDPWVRLQQNFIFFFTFPLFPNSLSEHVLLGSKGGGEGGKNYKNPLNLRLLKA